MNKSFLSLVLGTVFASSFVIGSAYADPKLAGTETGYSSTQLMQMGEQQAKLHWVSVADIEKSLEGKPPMAVGFDIDDTVLFSSPGFYHGQQVFSPNGYSYLKNQKFWNKMNCEWDVFSLPKDIGKELIAMHQKRGDSIYFITGRDPSTCKEITSDYLQKVFNIKHMNPVVFAGSSKTEYTKTKYIKDNHIKLYYGDSDGDIISARHAGAEGIRIIRASNSSYKPIAQNGIYGEKVVENSQY
ncbi:acid phosphatase AphA [Photobacterium damselae]